MTVIPTSPRFNFHGKTVPKSLRELRGQDLYKQSEPRVLPYSDGLLYTELPFTDNALTIVTKRYLQKEDMVKVIETPEQMFKRVADCLANVEKKYGATDEEVQFLSGQFYEIMANFEFLPGGRTLANAGTGKTVVVPNCIVLNIPDDLKGIMKTLTHATLLQQLGSGIGFAFDTLRPAGFPTKRTQGTASGPCSYLDMYDHTFNIIKQQNRHGANMGIAGVNHPDILEWIHMKDKEGRIPNFNISVDLTDEFMNKVRTKDPSPWMCTWEGKQYKPRRITRNEKFQCIGIVPVDMTASEIYAEICKSSHSMAEPGVVFRDTVNKLNPLPGFGRIIASNPCGEQFLHSGDVCNLGSINESKFIDDNGNIMQERLNYVSGLATRLLDNVVDVTDLPVKHVKEVSSGTRRIGLGVMGHGSALYKMRIGYNTDEGRYIAKHIMSTIQKEGWKMSYALGDLKGPFSSHPLSIFANDKKKPRNVAITNVPPTGTTSMMVDVSNGIEPFFALAYFKQGIMGTDMKLHYINDELADALKDEGIHKAEILAKIAASGSVQNIPEIPAHIKKVFVAAMDISALDHIRMQAAFQEHCDNAISKTINFPEEATEEDIKDGYMLAWSLGCKGTTVYRNNCRTYQVLNLNEKPVESNGVTKKEIETADVNLDVINDAGISEALSEPTSPSRNSSDSEQDDFVLVDGNLRNNEDDHDTDNDDDDDVEFISIKKKESSPNNVRHNGSSGNTTKTVLHIDVTIESNLKQSVHIGKPLSPNRLHKAIPGITHCPNCVGIELRRSEGCKMCPQCTFSLCTI